MKIINYCIKNLTGPLKKSVNSLILAQEHVFT